MIQHQEAQPISLDSQWKSYSVYGITLMSDFSFSSQLLDARGIADLTFTCVENFPKDKIGNNWLDSQPIYTSPNLTEDGQRSQFYIYKSAQFNLLRLTDIFDFYVSSQEIICHLINPDYACSVEIWLLGMVLSYWLERRDILALHASAIAIDPHSAIAFLASNTGGKSTLAATLMQANYSLLTDDILPVENCDGLVWGYPGYPQMRMWPDQAKHFIDRVSNLAKVHPALEKRRIPVGTKGLGTFCSSKRLIKCFYLPERRDPSRWGNGIEIEPLPKTNSIISLIQHSFIPEVVQGVGLQPRRLKQLTEIITNIPVRRLVYPSQVDCLLEVKDAILEDISTIK